MSVSKLALGYISSHPLILQRERVLSGKEEIMVEVTGGKPVEWTPEMEQTPAQQALRNKVSASLLKRVQAPAKRANLRVTQANQEFNQAVQRIKKGKEDLDEAKRADLFLQHRIDSKNRTAANVQFNMQGLDREARSMPNRHDRRLSSIQSNDISDFQRDPKEDVPTLERGFHGGLEDSKLHIRRRTVGSQGKDSTNMVSQPIYDIADSKTRFVSAKPTPYYEPSVGEARVAPGFDYIVDATDRGIVIVDPRQRLVSNIMTPEQYDAVVKKRGFFPFDPFAGTAHRFGEGNPDTDEVARRAIQDAIHLLQGPKVHKGGLMYPILEMETELEKSLLPLIPTP